MRELARCWWSPGLPVMFLVARNGTVDARIDGESDLHALEDHMKQLVSQH
jgi:hypothetical protein